MEKKFRNPFVSLRDCKDVAAIDKLLDEIGLSQEVDKRLFFLYDIMGVKQVFCANELTLQERYAVAKEELVSGIWKP